MDQDGFAGAQVSLGPKSVMRGDKDFRHGGSLRPVKVGRDFRQQMLISNNVFGVRAAADQAKDALAGLPSANRRADFRHLASKLHAGNLGRKPGRRRIFALALEQVSAVERRCADADQNLFIIDKGFAHSADFQHFRAAIGRDPDCLHGVVHGHGDARK